MSRIYLYTLPQTCRDIDKTNVFPHQSILKFIAHGVIVNLESTTNWWTALLCVYVGLRITILIYRKFFLKSNCTPYSIGA